METDQFAAEGPLQTLCISRLLTDGVVETEGGAHFTACVPDYARDEAFQKEYVAAAGDPDAWAAFTERFLAVDETGLPGGRRPGQGGADGQGRRPRRPPSAPRGSPMSTPPPASKVRTAPGSPGPSTAPSPVPRCSAATARSWPAPSVRHPALGARLARLTFAPDLVLTDGDAALVAGVPGPGRRPVHPGARVPHALPEGVRHRVVGTAEPDHDGLPDRPDRQPEHQRHRRRGPGPRSS